MWIGSWQMAAACNPTVLLERRQPACPSGGAVQPRVPLQQRSYWAWGCTAVLPGCPGIAVCSPSRMIWPPSLLSQLFEEFEPQPIAAASLGQVHVAKVRPSQRRCSILAAGAACV